MYTRILVPIDGSHTSTRGLQEAVNLAKSLNAAILLVHVVDESALVTSPDIGALDSGQLLNDFAKIGKQVIKNGLSLVERHGVKAESAIHENLIGRVADVILKQARDWRADLIVMGTHGRRGITHAVMGSDAEAVLRSSPVPVLLVRAPS